MKRNSGFTFIELLVAMGAAAIVMTAVYMTFHSQHKSYIVQEQASDMQQNLRSAMYYMEREIRMAGCDPTEDAAAGIVTNAAAQVRFTMDINNDADEGIPDGDTGDVGEDITYGLNNNQIWRDGNGNGALDAGEELADNIELLRFYYLNSNGAQTGSLMQTRSVQIAVLARTNKDEQGYTNDNIYTVTLPDGTQINLGPYNDNRRRKLLTTVIRCRNLGV